ncbi:MAG: hypothetical protein LBJ00_05445 [Planctomycetaceae bacterium]|nr:hypothetical protein [Planctomycetaceae bacterium]
MMCVTSGCVHHAPMRGLRKIFVCYTEATLKFLKLNTQAQQREAVVQGRSLSPYRLRYRFNCEQFKVDRRLR